MFERPPPRLGEHNRAVFRTIGYSEDAIDEMAELGAFGEQ